MLFKRKTHVLLVVALAFLLVSTSFGKGEIDWKVLSTISSEPPIPVDNFNPVKKAEILQGYFLSQTGFIPYELPDATDPNFKADNNGNDVKLIIDQPSHIFYDPKFGARCCISKRQKSKRVD
ncbi:MAG: hypothetical protein P9L92_12445 [Candidatus Electryonea clarkiae]|nr:hypothetical protein [Candidatus Electryonea clarkiae]MDP8287564.1 hypothetical protein [Candidatus Electryonea clarkiae]